MNPFDMAVVAIMGYCIIRGIFRGVIREIAAIVGVVGGFYVAYTRHQGLAPFLGQWISNPTYVNIISFLLIFTVIFTLVTGLGILLRTLLKAVFLGFIDRFFGAVFGVAKGVVLAALLFFLLTTFLPQKGAYAVRHSVTGPAVNRAAGVLVLLVPEGVRARIEKRILGLKEKWEKTDGEKPPETEQKESVPVPGKGI